MAPLVLESISMAVSKMKLLASFQEACQLAASGKMPAHTTLFLISPLPWKEETTDVFTFSDFFSIQHLKSPLFVPSMNYLP